MHELSSAQTSRFSDFVVPHLEKIVRMGKSETEKLVMIGRVVDAALRDLLPPYVCEERSEDIGPAVTTPHTDGSIDRLASYQKQLRQSGIAPEIQSHILGQMELLVLDELASSNRKRSLPKQCN